MATSAERARYASEMRSLGRAAGPDGMPWEKRQDVVTKLIGNKVRSIYSHLAMNLRDLQKACSTHTLLRRHCTLKYAHFRRAWACIKINPCTSVWYLWRSRRPRSTAVMVEAAWSWNFLRRRSLSTCLRS